MKQIPLIDRTGVVRAWADRSTGWISNLNGKIFALIEFDGVFKAQAIAEQIGWFDGDHLRDRLGRVVLARPSAKIEGIVMPHSQKIPPAPRLRLPIGRPVLKWLLPPPLKQRVWTDFKSLADDGLAEVRAFEEQLRGFVSKSARTLEKKSPSDLLDPEVDVF
jgi:hypothetical protein